MNGALDHFRAWQIAGKGIYKGEEKMSEKETIHKAKTYAEMVHGGGFSPEVWSTPNRMRERLLLTFHAYMDGYAVGREDSIKPVSESLKALPNNDSIF